MTTTEPASRYVPAAGRRAFTGLYDTAVALTMREARWRPRLRDHVLNGVPEGGRVVDVGAGTGTLAIELACARPDVDVLALDGDPDVLCRARRKPGADGVRWHQGLAADVPLEDDSADALVMSLLLHHLDDGAKDASLREARRVLRPGGRLHIADWGRPRGLLGKAGFFALRLIDGFDGTRDHAAGRLPHRVEAVGFGDVAAYASVRTAWGRLEVFSAAAQLLPRVVTLGER